MQNNMPTYLLGDHLGSTSITTFENGNLASEMKYKAWGEVRCTSGVTTTDYTYTGQYSNTGDFGLMFYNARWYDPALGRFAQADTFVPGGVQGWNRYAYTSNNPILYNDPSGHCGPLCAGIVIVATVSVVAIVFAAPFVASASGYGADSIGAMTTMAFTDTDNAVVAAGLTVPSQYPWAIFGGGGRGLAQSTDAELMDGEKDPYSSAVAEAVLGERIDNAITNRGPTRCANNVDKLIVAAIAQNDYELDFKSLPKESDKSIDWQRFFDSNVGSSTSDRFAQIRQDVTGMDYNTDLMLKIYIQDLRLLMKLGYDLPDWVTEKDIETIEKNYLAK